MRRSIALLSVIGALLGCTFSPLDDTILVTEIRKDIRKWDGEAVAVRGWLGECGGNDCAIYPSLEDARTVQKASHESKVWSAAMDRRLSIGFDESFDLIAGRMAFKEVVVFGIIDATCSDYLYPSEGRKKFMCLDRASDLIPTSIQMILL